MMDYRRRINQAIDYIEKNYSEKLSLEDLANAANFSPFHFHRIFSAFAGETPGNFITRIRLEKSLSILTSKNSPPITQAALESGFTSSSHYSKAFRKQYGISPRAYIKDSKKRKVIPSTLGYPDIEKIKLEANNYNCEIREIERRTVVYLRIRGLNPADIGKGWHKLMSWGKRNHCLDSSTLRIAVNWDNPEFTSNDKIRFDVGFTVSEIPELQEPFGLLQLDEGRYAVSRFEGDAQAMELFFYWVYGIWLPDRGLEPSNRPAYRVYHSDTSSHRNNFFSFDFCMPLK